jgi:hypothetical protein
MRLLHDLLRVSTLFALSVASVVSAQQLAPLEQQVSGTWRLIGTEQKMKDGSTRPNPAYGLKPLGYVMYDPTHHMCLFLTRSQAGETEPAPLGNGLNAYCGRWKVDAATRTMYHITEMDVLPTRAAIVRQPTFELQGNRLYLHPPFDKSEIVSNTLIFERAVN